MNYYDKAYLKKAIQAGLDKKMDIMHVNYSNQIIETDLDEGKIAARLVSIANLVRPVIEMHVHLGVKNKNSKLPILDIKCLDKRRRLCNVYKF